MSTMEIIEIVFMSLLLLWVVLPAIFGAKIRNIFPKTWFMPAIWCVIAIMLLMLVWALVEIIPTISPTAMVLTLLIVGLIFVLGYIPNKYNIRKNRRIAHENWKAVAKVAGLTKTEKAFPKPSDELELEGEYEGNLLRVYIESVSDDDDLEGNTNIDTFPNNPGLYSLLVRRNMTNNDCLAESLFDVRTGDSEFDDVFLVKSNNEKFVQHVLDATIRKTLLEEFADMTMFLDQDLGLEFSMKGLVESGEKLIAAIKTVSSLTKNAESFLRTLAKDPVSPEEIETTRNLWLDVSKAAGMTDVDIVADNKEYAYDLVMSGSVGKRYIHMCLDYLLENDSSYIYTTIYAYLDNPDQHIFDIRQINRTSPSTTNDSKTVFTDDKDFNKTFCMITDDRAFFKHIFTQQIRQNILRELHDADFELIDDKLKCKIRGLESNREKLIAAIKLIAEIGAQIDSQQE